MGRASRLPWCSVTWCLIWINVVTTCCRKICPASMKIYHLTAPEGEIKNTSVCDQLLLLLLYFLFFFLFCKSAHECCICYVVALVISINSRNNIVSRKPSCVTAIHISCKYPRPLDTSAVCNCKVYGKISTRRYP